MFFFVEYLFLLNYYSIKFYLKFHSNPWSWWCFCQIGIGTRTRIHLQTSNSFFNLIYFETPYMYDETKTLCIIFYFGWKFWTDLKSAFLNCNIVSSTFPSSSSENWINKIARVYLNLNLPKSISFLIFLNLQQSEQLRKLKEDGISQVEYHQQQINVLGDALKRHKEMLAKLKK